MEYNAQEGHHERRAISPRYSCTEAETPHLRLVSYTVRSVGPRLLGILSRLGAGCLRLPDVFFHLNGHCGYICADTGSIRFHCDRDLDRLGLWRHACRYPCRLYRARENFDDYSRCLRRLHIPLWFRAELSSPAHFPLSPGPGIWRRMGSRGRTDCRGLQSRAAGPRPWYDPERLGDWLGPFAARLYACLQPVPALHRMARRLLAGYPARSAHYLCAHKTEGRAGHLQEGARPGGGAG